MLKSWSLFAILIIFLFFYYRSTEPQFDPNARRTEIYQENRPLFKTSRPTADPQALQADLINILKIANQSKNAIVFARAQINNDAPFFVEIICSYNSIKILISASDEEWGSAFYYGLHRLGFLFPHPRKQISPSTTQMRKSCGQKYKWQPRLAYRGFHLHTMHPNEWVYGFLEDNVDIGREMIQWSARNMQSVLQVLLLKDDPRLIAKKLKPLIQYSHDLGVSFGIDVSFNMIQQKAYRLTGRSSTAKAFFNNFFINPLPELASSLNELIDLIDFDFMTIELGSSEFTSSGFHQTLNKLNTAADILKSKNKGLFIKIHSSTGQDHPVLGNFNFLPQYADTHVGVLPHTVMYYGLFDAYTPVYGRNNFLDMAQFLKEQASVRPTWYYPETSYFIAMDIDVPLFLTDYLIARSQDYDFTVLSGAQGHINFTTGHELGYWLKDWTIALLALKDYENRPLVGLELLGESVTVWESLVRFQTEFFKNKMIYEELSSANLLDEIPIGFETHRRTIFRRLRHRLDILGPRIRVLEEAVAARPSLDGVKNTELKILLEITHLRIEHALHLRRALFLKAQNSRDRVEFVQHLKSAKNIRETAQELMSEFLKSYSRYPEIPIFEWNKNRTSYDFGYGYTAKDLHFWKREEEMIRQNNYWPWFMQIINPLEILF